MSSVQRFYYCIFFFLFLTSNAYSQAFVSSNLPIVLLTTNGQVINDYVKINANMGIIWNGPGKRNALVDPENNFNGNISIEIRGSSSQMFPKKSYGFETKSSDWVNLDVSLIDLPEENDWILYAPYTDKTMIRDVLTYTLDASLGHYTPRCRYVELFVNDEYQGVYVLMEKIKRNKNRVDIAKLLPTDISGENLTGGYIIKIDKTTGGSGEGWHSDYINNTNKTYYQYHYPQSDEITTEQKKYIQSYVRNMEQSLYTERFSGQGSYHEYLNDSSFIDFMIINELSKNIDGYRLSSFLYKGKNKLMNCGPIWDFNLTYGNADYLNAWLPTGFQYQATMEGDNWQNPFWWNRLMRDPAYVQKLKRRWSWIRKNQFSDQRIKFVTDSLVSLLSEAQVRNYQKWTGVIGSYVWPNYFIGSSYAAEVTWMKDWLTKRLAFLDKSWPYNFTGSENLQASASISIYPNPFTDRLEIQLAPSLNGSALVELFSTSGMLMLKIKADIQNGHVQLDFSENNSIPLGMYVIRVSQNNQVLLNEKIVKRPSGSRGF